MAQIGRCDFFYFQIVEILSEFYPESKEISKIIEREIGGDTNRGVTWRIHKLQQVQQEIEKDDTEWDTTGINFSKLWA